MSIRDRKTLKSLFKNGSLPTESNFEDIIDSSINKIDDGLSKSMEDGLMLSPIGDAKKVLSIFYKITDSEPEWSINLEEKKVKESLNRQLSFTHEGLKKPLLTLTNEGKVGINNDQPQTTLDVDGFVGSKGRLGTAAEKSTAPADGKWHTIVGGLNHCNVFEVIARTGIHKSGKHALIHAIASSAYGNSHHRIKRLNTRFSLWRPIKIKLRWVGTTYNYALQIRTTQNLGKGVKIKYFITQLWNDEEMGIPEHYMKTK